MPAVAVLTAAGSGLRLDANKPKALVEVGGQTLLELALERVLAANAVEAVVVTCTADDMHSFQRVVDSVITPGDDRVRVVPGGKSRQGSVLAGLEELERWLAIPTSSDIPVVVHDAARSLTPTELIDELIDLIRKGVPGALPGLPVVDTIKIVDPDTGVVTTTPRRDELRSIQTPQAFQWSVLRRAHQEHRALAESETTAATDDSILVENLGYPVTVIEGSPLAFKVTVPEDLERTHAILVGTGH